MADGKSTRPPALKSRQSVAPLMRLESLLGDSLSLKIKPSGAYLQVMAVNTRGASLNSSFQFELTDGKATVRSKTLRLFQSHKLYFPPRTFDGQSPQQVKAAVAKWRVAVVATRKEAGVHGSLVLPPSFEVHDVWTGCESGVPEWSGLDEEAARTKIVVPDDPILQHDIEDANSLLEDLGDASKHKKSRHNHVVDGNAMAVLVRVFVNIPSVAEDVFLPRPDILASQPKPPNRGLVRSFGKDSLMLSFTSAHLVELASYLSICIRRPLGPCTHRHVLQSGVELAEHKRLAIERHTAQRPPSLEGVLEAFGLDPELAEVVVDRGRAFDPFPSQAYELWMRLQLARDLPDLYNNQEKAGVWLEWERARIHTILFGFMENPVLQASFEWSWTLTVNVVRASGLAAMDMNGLSDPFVKVSLGSMSKRTKHHNRTLSPVFNHKFTFMRQGVDLCDGPLTFQVMDYDLGRPDDLIGIATVDLEMVADGRFRAGWLPLYRDGAMDKSYGELLVEIQLTVTEFRPRPGAKDAFDQQYRTQFFSESGNRKFYNVMEPMYPVKSMTDAEAAASFTVDLRPHGKCNLLLVLLLVYARADRDGELDEDEWKWLAVEFCARYGITSFERKAAEVRSLLLAAHYLESAEGVVMLDEWLEEVERLTAQLQSRIAMASFPPPSNELPPAPHGRLGIMQESQLQPPPHPTICTQWPEVQKLLFDVVSRIFHFYPTMPIFPPEDESGFKNLLKVLVLCKDAPGITLDVVNQVIRSNVKKATNHSLLLGYGEDQINIDEVDPLTIDLMMLWLRSAQNIVDAHYLYFTPVVHAVFPRLQMMQMVCDAVWTNIAVHVDAFLDWHAPPKGMGLALRVDQVPLSDREATNSALTANLRIEEHKQHARFKSGEVHPQDVTSISGERSLLYPAIQMFALRRQLYELLFKTRCSGTFRGFINPRAIALTLRGFNPYVTWWISHVRMTINHIVARALSADSFAPHGNIQAASCIVDFFSAVYQFIDFMRWSALDSDNAGALAFVVGICAITKSLIGSLAAVENNSHGLPTARSQQSLGTLLHGNALVRQESPLVQPGSLVDHFREQFKDRADEHLQKADLMHRSLEGTLAVHLPPTEICVSAELCCRLNTISNARAQLMDLLSDGFKLDIGAILDYQDSLEAPPDVGDDPNANFKDKDGQESDDDSNDSDEERAQGRQLKREQDFDSLRDHIASIALPVQARMLDVVTRAGREIRGALWEVEGQVAAAIVAPINLLYVVGDGGEFAEDRLAPYLRLLDAHLGSLNPLLTPEVFRGTLLRVYEAILAAVVDAVLRPTKNEGNYLGRGLLGFVVDEFTDFLHAGGAGIKMETAKLKQRKARRMINAHGESTSTLMRHADYLTALSEQQEKAREGKDDGDNNGGGNNGNGGEEGGEGRDERASSVSGPNTDWRDLLVEDIVAVLGARQFDAVAMEYKNESAKHNREVYVNQMFPEIPAEEDVIVEGTATNKRHHPGRIFITDHYLLFRQDRDHGKPTSLSKLVLPLSRLKRVQIYRHWKSGESVRFLTATDEKFTFHCIANTAVFAAKVVGQAKAVGKVVAFENISGLQRRSFVVDEMGKMLEESFGVPATDLVAHFKAYTGTIASQKHGVLFVAQANIFFKPLKKDKGKVAISLAQVAAIQAHNTAMVLQTGVRVTTTTGKEVVFVLPSMSARAEAMAVMLSQWHEQSKG